MIKYIIFTSNDFKKWKNNKKYKNKVFKQY